MQLIVVFEIILISTSNSMSSTFEAVESPDECRYILAGLMEKRFVLICILSRKLQVMSDLLSLYNV